jgi:6-phosphogluconate dehydrogenase
VRDYLDPPVFARKAPADPREGRFARRERLRLRRPDRRRPPLKMVHNGTGYGMMQPYAEGFDILRNKDSKDLPEGERFALNMPDIAEVWRRGSVISFWLLDLRAPHGSFMPTRRKPRRLKWPRMRMPAHA